MTDSRAIELAEKALGEALWFYDYDAEHQPKHGAVKKIAKAILAAIEEEKTKTAKET